MTAATSQIENRPEPIAAIADFMAGFSLEATRPSAEEIAALAAIAPPATRVYLSAVPKKPAQEAIEAAAQLRKAGFEPVPHLAARGFASARALNDFLARLSGEAGVVRLLIIAGDHEEPVGDFRSAIEVIDGGALQRHDIREIGIAGYPDGHPRILQQDLDRALADKIRSAEATGMAVHIVSQFCFDAQAIVQWIARLRDFGLDHPGSALPDPPIWPPCCVTPSAAGCGHRPRASRGRPACCGSCSPCRRRMAWCARSRKRARSCTSRTLRRTSSRSAGCCGPRAGPRRWRSVGSRSKRTADSGSSRRAQKQ